MIETAKVNRVLFVKLTSSEKIDRSVKATRLAAEISNLKADAKAEADRFKRLLKEPEAEHSAAVAAYINGAEWRAIDCEQVFDTDQKLTWYEHNGERYSVRPMTDQEYRECTQRLFKDEEPKGDQPKAKKKKSKADPNLLPRNVSPIGIAANGDVADVVKQESSKRGKKDHTI